MYCHCTPTVPEVHQCSIGLLPVEVGEVGEGAPVPPHPGHGGTWLPAHVAGDPAPGVVGEGEEGGQGAGEIRTVAVGKQDHAYRIRLQMYSTLIGLFFP